MCLIGMLLVSRSGLVEEGAVQVFHYYEFHCPLLSCIPISFPHPHAVVQLAVHLPSRIASHPKYQKLA